jgi:prepilin-type N-terminal cleavage/methylation domain-containing protein
MSRPSHARGFSVLEIMITIVVVGVALVPLLLSFKTSTRTVTGTRDHLTAVAFAQTALEELKSTAFRKPSGTGTASAVKTLDDKLAELNGPAKTLEENGVTFERTVALFPGPVANLPAGQPDLMVVQVTVKWTAPGLVGVAQEYQLFSALGSATQP